MKGPLNPTPIPDGEVQQWQCEVCHTWNTAKHCKKCGGDGTLTARAFQVGRKLSAVETNFYQTTAVEMLMELQEIRRMLRELVDRHEENKRTIGDL